MHTHRCSLAPRAVGSESGSYWERPLAKTVEWAQEHLDEIKLELKWCNEFKWRNATPPPGFCTLLRTLAEAHDAALTSREMETEEARPTLSWLPYPLIRPLVILARTRRTRLYVRTWSVSCMRACARVHARGDPQCVAGAPSCARACVYGSSARPRARGVHGRA